MATWRRPSAPVVIARVAPAAPQAVVLLTMAVTMLVAMWKEFVLPDKYFADSEHVQLLMGAAAPSQTDPFARTAWLYQQLGPLGSPGPVSTLTLLLAFGALFACVPFSRLRLFTVTNTMVVVFALLMASIYLAQYSKELLVLLIALLVAVTPKSRWWLVLHVSVMAVYAWWIRPYWGITAAGYVLMVFLLPRLRSLWPLVPPVVAAYFAMAFATNAVMGAELTSFRAQVNDFRTFSSDAKSMIVELIPGEGPVVAGANILLDLVGLVVPFPLVLHPSPQYLGFGVIICALWLSMFRSAQRAARSGTFAQDAKLTRAVALLVCVVCVQAIFEPDYGSYIKHLTPVLPLFLVVIDRTRGVHTPAHGTARVAALEPA